MRTFLLTSFLFVLACDPSVARTVIVDPSAARATMESHEGSRVVAVASTRDSVKFRVVYRPGQEIPGEGVVRKRDSTPMMAVGAILLGAGVLAAASSGLCFLAPADAFMDFRGACAFMLIVAGGVLGVGPGIGLLAGGARAVAYVGGRARVRITPTVSHNGGGLSLSVGF